MWPLIVVAVIVLGALFFLHAVLVAKPPKSYKHAEHLADDAKASVLKGKCADCQGKTIVLDPRAENFQDITCSECGAIFRFGLDRGELRLAVRLQRGVRATGFGR